ncbi:MAG: hypothetical protein AAGA30_21765, partial [Planctomycetota bacterium]
LYAGNPAWKIKSVTSENPNIKVQTNEIQRNPETQRVDYELLVDLDKNQPVGQFKDQLLIHTNDINNKILTVNIEGNVKSVVQVSPVRLGLVNKDEEIEKKLIIRGERPFGIKSIIANDERIQFAPANGSKTLHIISYRLDTSTVGQIASKITIVTDDPDQAETSVDFAAQIVPATFALDQNQ